MLHYRIFPLRHTIFIFILPILLLLPLSAYHYYTSFQYLRIAEYIIAACHAMTEYYAIAASPHLRADAIISLEVAITPHYERHFTSYYHSLHVYACCSLSDIRRDAIERCYDYLPYMLIR